MAQDEGREEPDDIRKESDDADVTPEGSTEDLPEFLHTEPIPITPPAEQETDAEEHQEPEEEPQLGAGEQTEVFERGSINDRDVEAAPDAPAAPETATAQEPDPYFPGEPYEAEPEQRGAVVKEKSKGKKVAIIASAAVLVLGLVYVGAAWFFADRVPADTTVAGVDISNLSRQDAVDRLATELDEVSTSEISMSLGEAESAIDPEVAGLYVDIGGTVDELVGFSLDPVSVFGHLFGRGAHEPVIQADTDDLRQALTTIAADLNVAPVEGELAIVDGEVEVVEPEDGVSVDIDASLPLIVEEWLQGSRPIALPEEVTTPTMDADRIEQTQRNLLDPLFSGPVPLTINEEETEIPNDVIVDAATLHLVDTTYEVQLDPDELAEEVGELLPELGESPKDARFEFKDGKPHVVPSVTGAGIEPVELAEKVADAAGKTGEGRHAEMELETTEPDFTTEDAEELGVKERVAHFSTPVPYDPVRTKNLVNGAKKLTGILIKPGETFSLIEALGPIDAAHGYVSSGVVVNGFEDTAMGGGLSQMSTTMFNAAFEAGMEDVAHTPHSRFFQRYPEGREATMFAPSLDMKWRNNTPYGVLVQSWIDGDAHVALWSTKYWDTKITTGPRTNITAPKTVYNTNSRCTPESGGSSGFTVTVQRIVSKEGVRNDEFSRSYSHTYQPWNHVICGEKPKEKPKSEKSSDSDD